MREINRPLRAARAALVLVAAAAITGCTGRDLERFRDAPVESRDDSAAVVVNMPDGYGNVALKCVELDGNWVVVTSTFTADGSAGRGVSVVDGSGPFQPYLALVKAIEQGARGDIREAADGCQHFLCLEIPVAPGEGDDHRIDDKSCGVNAFSQNAVVNVHGDGQSFVRVRRQASRSSSVTAVRR